ncbi:hypothetical protein FGL98_24945 [Leekyejoonella antrihumi]|uniref:Uncharacterized protein n=1 Tax=Leekyejoonella antrihumi TaxID=1660198 RepID=A0A563DNV7_9MICO|nr:hypothetical protein FGL98_24945 [Leekyejoonella antrihumi]
MAAALPIAPAAHADGITTGPVCQLQDCSADFGFFDLSGADYAVGSDISASQLTAQQVPLSAVDANASGNQPTWDEGTIYDGTLDAQTAEELAVPNDGVLPVPGTADDTGDPSAAPVPAISPADDGGVQPASSDLAYKLMYWWHDGKGVRINYRHGNSGWGNYKVVNKHNLNYLVSFMTTRYPAPGERIQESSSSIVYRTKVYHVVCKGWWIFRSCKITKKVWVRAIVNPKVKGVITTWAEGYVRAPSWIKSAINLRA